MNEPLNHILQLFDLPGADDDEQDDAEEVKRIGKDAKQSQSYGEKALQEGAYTEAIDHFKRAVAQGRTDEEALLDLGAAYEAADLLPQAYYQYKKAAKKTESSDLHLGMSALYRRYGRLEQATKEIRDAIEKNPEDSYLRFRLAEILRLNGYKKASHEALSGAISVKPEDPFYHYWNADLLIDMQEFHEALNACQAAVELSPADVHVMLLSAIALWGADKREEAVRAARLATELTTDDSRVAVIVLRQLLKASGKQTEADELNQKVQNSDWYDAESAAKLLRRIRLDKEQEPYMR